MISIQIHGTATDTTDDRYRAEEAALAVFRAAGCSPAAAQAEYYRQFDEMDCETGMTGLAATWLKAREAAERAARSSWANPAGCWVEMRA